MLTKDLLRVAVDNGQARPRLIKATPAVLALAEALLAHWNAGVGSTLGELEDGALTILHGSKSLLVAKGLQKLIVDGCTFRDATSCSALREAVLAQSAARLARLAPGADLATYRQAVAQAVDLALPQLSERLYGDLPDAAVLEQGYPGDAAALLAAYNLAQCQGLLLTASEMTVVVQDADTGLRRRLLKALRFERLLAEVRQEGDGLKLIISGPGSVLDQASRYGLALARFLPALTTAKRWSATAWVCPDRHGGGRAPLRCELSHELGLRGDTRFIGFVPDEVQALVEEVRARQPEWVIEDPQLLPLANGELVVPDLQLRLPDGRVVAVELFHRWHAAPLTRRLAQLAGGQLPQLLIAVDRAVAKRPEHAGLAENTVFSQRGFLFNDLPTARMLATAVERQPEARKAPSRRR